MDFCFRDVRVLNSPIISLTMGRRVSTLKTRGFLSSIPLIRAIAEERLAEPITIYFEHKPGPNATQTTGANAVCVLWVTSLLFISLATFQPSLKHTGTWLFEIGGDLLLAIYCNVTENV